MRWAGGFAISSMIVVALLSGTAIALRRDAPVAARSVWTFSEPHARQLRTTARVTTRATAPAVDVTVVAARALDVRLQSLAASGLTHGGPTLVEIEIGSVGKYFRGEADDVPFLPLTDRLRRAGWLGRLSPARLAVWTKGGEVFGVPLDAHPVSLTYRKDLFDAAGIDLSTATTWDELRERCAAFESVERGRGRRTRALQLSSGSSDALVMMLQQRGIDLVDGNDAIHLTDPRVAATVTLYARMVAGPTRVSTDPSPGPGRWATDLARGDVAAALTPDWSIDDLRAMAPGLAGNLAMRSLPVFDPSDAPTASWGGTMVAIPRACRDPDAAWVLLERLYLSEDARRTRWRISGILPAVTDWWDDAAFAPPDPLFAGQPIGSLYADLARRLPARRVTPFTATAASALSLVLYRATAAIERGHDAMLEADVRRWLVEAADDLQRRIAFATLGS